MPELMLTPFPGERDAAVFLMCEGAEEARAVFAALAAPRPAVVAVTGFDWQRGLPPWPAPAVFRGADFGGGADALLQTLLTRLAAYPAGTRVLAGYSLAGLFAVYAACRTRAFDAVAAASPSLWYDGFLPYLTAHAADFGAGACAVSIGDREKRTKNPRMARGEDCCRAAVAVLSASGVAAAFDLEAGNHFTDAPGRTARCISRALSALDAAAGLRYNTGATERHMN